MKQNSQAALVLAAIFFVLVACSITSGTPVTPTQRVVIDATLTAAPSQTPVQAVDVTFKTPEETITYYFDGIMQNNLSKILQACAINEMGEKFNFAMHVERLGGVMAPAQFLSPTDYAFYSELNKVTVSSQILNQVKFFTYGLLSSEKVDDGSLILNMDSARVNKFIQDVNPRKLSNIEIKKIGLPNKTLMNDPKYIENAKKSASLYGADESTERVALFSFEQSYYYIGFTLLRYGENWKISSQGSPLANTNVLGTPLKITIEEFDSMVNSQ
jgi:hypothetical protein